MEILIYLFFSTYWMTLGSPETFVTLDRLNHFNLVWDFIVAPGCGKTPLARSTYGCRSC